MPLAEKVSQCDLRISILCLLCLAVCFFGYRIYKHPAICRALLSYRFFCFVELMTHDALFKGAFGHSGLPTRRMLATIPMKTMCEEFLATPDMHRGRFAFSVFAFLVGFGLQAALGSAWISQNRGETNGITEKAPVGSRDGLAGPVLGRSREVPVECGQNVGKMWKSVGISPDFHSD